MPPRKRIPYVGRGYIPPPKVRPTKPSQSQAALIKKLFTAGYSKTNIREILASTPIREKWKGPQLDMKSIARQTNLLETKNPKIKMMIWMGKGKRRKSKTVELLELRKQKIDRNRSHRISNRARVAGYLYKYTSSLTKEGMLARKSYREQWLSERKRMDTDRKY